MKTILTLLSIVAITININAQTVELPDTLISINAEYLSASNLDNACTYVKELEEVLLNYDHSELAKLYYNNKDIYQVSFKTSEGKIIAWFNNKGKIIKTYEKYNNVRLPQVVMQAIVSQYPNYSNIKDVYLVQYHNDKAQVKREYKIKIKNKDEILILKTNAEGDFI